jgi:translocator protein
MKLIISILLPLCIGFVSGYATAGNINGWYATLNKPWFSPPNYLFGPVWTGLYIMMGIALWLIWKEPSAKPYRNTALLLFGIQLLFNFFWTFIFFQWKQMGWALAEIIVLWVLLFITIIFFGKINKTAAWLLVPYICWVSFATLLNAGYWRLNR